MDLLTEPPENLFQVLDDDEYPEWCTFSPRRCVSPFEVVEPTPRSPSEPIIRRVMSRRRNPQKDTTCPVDESLQLEGVVSWIYQGWTKKDIIKACARYKTRAWQNDDILDCQTFLVPMYQAADILGIGTTVLKRRMRARGIVHWPYRMLRLIRTVVHNYPDFSREDTVRAIRDAVYRTRPSIRRRVKKLAQMHFKAVHLQGVRKKVCAM